MPVLSTACEESTALSVSVKIKIANFAAEDLAGKTAIVRSTFDCN